MNLAELGHEIYLTRKRKKITQSTLAQSAGISRTTLSLIENGLMHEIGINKIIVLCELLGLELDVVTKSARPTLQQLMARKVNDA